MYTIFIWKGILSHSEQHYKPCSSLLLNFNLMSKICNLQDECSFERTKFKQKYKTVLEFRHIIYHQQHNWF